MASVDEIVTRLEDFSDSVCSEKVTVRNKAIDQIKQIFDDCRTTVQEILSGERPSSLTPKYVFSNVFNGMLKHATRQELTQTQRADNKAPVFITVLQYLIDYCNSIEANRIQTSLIFDSLLRIFEDGFYARQYGTQFLRMLDRFLSGSNHSNFFNIDKALWKRLLEGCKQMCDNCGEEARSLSIICMAKIMELGSKYSYLADNLVDYVPFVESLFTDISERHGNLKDLLSVAFLLTDILCVNYQFEMCLFGGNICPYVLRNYNTNMKEDVKSEIFQFLHLIMMIHEPLHKKASHDNYKPQDWSAIKSSIENVIELEVHYLAEYKFTRDSGVLPEAFLSCASYLYYLLINQPVPPPNDEVADTPNNTKRRRISSPFENMLSKISHPARFTCWKWFVILASTLNLRPLVKAPSATEIKSLFQITAQRIECPLSDMLCKSFYQIFLYLIEIKADSLPWSDITPGVYKLSLKYPSPHSIELLQFVIHQQFCAPKLILEIYKNLMESAVDEMDIKTMILLFQTNRRHEIIWDRLQDLELAKHFIKRSFLVKSSCFDAFADLMLAMYNIPVERSFTAKHISKKTAFEEKMEAVLARLSFKAIVIQVPEPKKSSSLAIDLNSKDLTPSILDLPLRLIFYDTQQEINMSPVVISLLGQLELATIFYNRLYSIMPSIGRSPKEDFFVRYRSVLSRLVTAFKSQISEDEREINNLLEALLSYLSLDFIEEMRDSSEFFKQAAIWAYNQYQEPDSNKRELFVLDDGRISLRNPKTKRNSLVIEIILRLGALKESIIRDQWIDISRVTNIMVSFNMMEKISKLSPNKTMAMKMIAELEDIFGVHYKNEQVSVMVLKTLTSLLDLFACHPISITEWDKIIIQCIKWTCKQKYSPQLAIHLLEFYEQFFVSFYEHRHLNPELQDLIAQSLPYFIKSTNFDVKMKAIQVLIRIISTKELPQEYSGITSKLSVVLEYSQFVRELINSLQLEDLLEIETSGGDNDNRFVNNDEVQNRTAIVHQMVYGASRYNEHLRGYFIKFLIDFIHKNRSSIRNKNVSIVRIVEQNLSFILDSWTKAGSPINSFPIDLVECKSTEDFVLNYQLEIGKNLIKNRPIKDFVEFQKKSSLPKIAKLVAEELLIFRIIPDHGLLEKNAIFNSNLQQLISDKDSQTLIRKKGVLLLHNLLNYYWDAEKFLEVYSYQWPKGVESIEDGFEINEKEFSSAISILNKFAVSNKVSFIVNICMKHPESVLLLLYSLQARVQLSNHTFSKLKSMLNVLKFSDLIMEFIERPSDNSQIDHYKAYFVKNICLFLLNVVNQEKEMGDSMRVSILGKFKEFISRTINHCLKMYKCNLNFIIRQLLETIAHLPVKSLLYEHTLDIVRYLIIDCEQLFGDVLEEIDIFPEDILKALGTSQDQYHKTSLRDEIRQFLEIPGRGVHSLEYLRKRINANSDEFVQIFKDITSGFRDLSNNQNLPQDLVYELLKYAQSSNERVRIEASKILGCIGPVDLNTLVFQRSGNEKNLLTAFMSLPSAIKHCLPEIVENMEEVLYKYDPEISSLIIKALIQVVYQKETETLLQQRPDLFIFKQVNETVPRFIQTPAKGEKLMGFDSINLSEMSLNDFINNNAKMLLPQFKNFSLAQLIEKNPEFGKKLLLLLMIMLLSLNDKELNLSIEEKFNKFFEDFELTYNSPVKPGHAPPLIKNPDLWKLMIDLVEIIRIYNQSQSLKLNLNYLRIAEAAHYCNFHGHAILYGELWIDQNGGIEDNQENENSSRGIRSIMIASYEAMEVPDAVKPFLDLNQSRYKYYMMENAWEFAYLENKTGFGDQEFNSSAVKKCNYEVFWRLGDWKQLKRHALEDESLLIDNDNHQRIHCLALKCAPPYNDIFGSRAYMQTLRNSIIKDITASRLDCTKSIYPYLTSLKQIKELEDFLNGIPLSTEVSFKQWIAYDGLQLNSFEQQEQILMQRVFLRQHTFIPVVKQQLINTLLRLVRLAKEERNFQVAVTNLKRLELQLKDETNDLRAQMILEDGHLQFIAGHGKLAEHLYSKLINEKAFEGTFSRIQALRLMTEHLTDSLLVNPNDIFKSYLAPAENLYHAYRRSNSQRTEGISRSMIVEEQVKIFDTTAKFADTIYTQRNNYMKSSEYAEKQKLHQESRAEFQTVDKKNLTQQDKVRLHTLRQTIALEEKELKAVTKERENYLELAVKLYTKSCTINEDQNDLKICRIISLWFTNIASEFLLLFMAKNLNQIPSYKFLLFLPQIAARLSHSDRKLTEIISNTLIRCCQQHPHHSVYHILALFNAHADNEHAQISSSMETRIENIKLIMCKLMEDSSVGEIVKAAQNLGMALITLANKDVKDAKDAKNTQISSDLMNLGDMYKIAAPTVEIPVNINGKYASFPYIVSWVPNFRMMGGINCPKKLNFLCSDGISRSMLAKGKDDLRQDAVMEQVFNIMNILLKSKQSSRKRNLSIRTYKIVPLTQMSGILEFCDNTTTIGNYLIAAHEKYRPKDKPINECRSMMAECAKGTAEEKLKQFQKVCKDLQPVFQNFFTENFFNPVEWFEKRMFYINSVATTSMVGYIMGIGDRHVNNILIDKSTAEVIHIDFGIAFEKGKLLPTPEKVPFRLTRDFVAAMGCYGVDGMFRKSCEITMQVLRENKALINTIIEVFLYDPLYTWLSNKKRSQDANDDEKNALATRVLIRVNEKLNGRDENDATAIENQVERLIRQATSPSNQSQMFYGWQPYL